jgi:hypothetical protein
MARSENPGANYSGRAQRVGGRLAKYDSTGLGRLESKVFSRLNPDNRTGK